MKVTLVASTVLRDNPVAETAFGDRMDYDLGYGVSDADLLGELAGRACYQAWNMPNPATAHNTGYLANILTQGHYSVLEHASFSFYVEGVSRSLTHELVRHRHLSYSELSQRYVNVAEAEVVTPPALREYGDLSSNLKEVFPEAHDEYERIVEALTANGLPRKQAREAARSVMPNAVETKIVVTGNLRAWRDFLGKRWAVHADAEIRELAGEVLRILREEAPASVQDIPAEPFA